MPVNNQQARKGQSGNMGKNTTRKGTNMSKPTTSGGGFWDTLSKGWEWFSNSGLGQVVKGGLSLIPGVGTVTNALWAGADMASSAYQSYQRGTAITYPMQLDNGGPQSLEPTGGQTVLRPGSSGFQSFNMNSTAPSPYMPSAGSFLGYEGYNAQPPAYTGFDPNSLVGRPYHGGYGGLSVGSPNTNLSFYDQSNNPANYTPRAAYKRSYDEIDYGPLIQQDLNNYNDYY
jgi:hypothetical protein